MIEKWRYSAAAFCYAHPIRSAVAGSTGTSSALRSTASSGRRRILGSSSSWAKDYSRYWVHPVRSREVRFGSGCRCVTCGPNTNVLSRREPWGLVEMWIEDPDGVPIVFVEVPADHPLRRDPR